MATDPLLSARTYQLFIDVTQTVRVVVGRFGCFDFPAGRYVYTGSALRNFEARVKRHLSPTKKMHWHIDYLLAAKGVCVSEVLCYAEAECVVNQQTQGEIVIAGFGSSDCRSGCCSHLKRLINRDSSA
ncbi:MAG: GIY-YIG nuclease family protein [Betaproteobacteria bacterium]